MRLLITILLTAISCLLQTAAYAYDFKVGDLEYDVTSYENHEVAVTGCPNKAIQSIDIPKFVTTDNGIRYIVRSINDAKEWGSAYHGVFSDCNALTSITLPESLTYIGTFAFYKCTSLTSVNLPKSLTNIGRSAFSRCSSLTSISQPESLTRIEDYAFYGCSSLSSVNFAESLTSIGTGAFSGCSSLVAVNLPESLTWIGSIAFKDCSSLAAVNLPESLATIQEATFSGCSSLSYLKLPRSLNRICNYAFYGCSSLESVELPESLQYIEYGAFRGCSSISSVNIQKAQVGQGAFANCAQLQKIDVSPDHYYTQIDGVLFANNVLLQYPAGRESAEYYIPESTDYILDYAFEGSKRLNTLYIPANISKIGDQAFLYCTELRTIYSSSQEPPAASSSSFSGVPTDAVVYIPKGSFDKYFVANGWQRFSDFREWDPSGIDEAINDASAYGVVVTTEGNIVKLANKQPESVCKVYNMQGLRMAETNASEITLPHPGMYIVEIEGTTKKVSI
ncbi:MAG: leucine-rich repeat domain-containing protein [Bacteroides sp.]|nr:leucine-rich repeat domain-containing protein [Alistipes timonensis]MCM1311230.1 leucine-rich repeat domain-containing protein [Bacteroides sp.]MCM1406500.1 leucine-rich repeat domain-containing protein [[Clostridium] fimetarium]